MLLLPSSFSVRRKLKKMPATTFGVNEKGIHRICNNNEILYELEPLLGKMLNGCAGCENCKNCHELLFVLEELRRVRFAEREKNDLWRIHKDTDEHSFEVEKTE